MTWRGCMEWREVWQQKEGEERGVGVGMKVGFGRNREEWRRDVGSGWRFGNEWR
ncbi:hypothetical protein DPMN_077003 [Dreissena polymorpha]|uniref:Uncharacterized protein n=1 Tax=Dreissena polymorpha TaxID=45954 RepID=A0A9D4BMX1_DREPO|nr:hypothetical protein DPMN_077003 [Dreissena polymorpha]